MAFLMNMPRVIVLLLLLIMSPPLFIHQAKNFAVADYKLIQTLCNYSQTPETCINCVQISNCADLTDIVGIAKIIVGCLEGGANILAHNMTKLASTSHGTLKSIYQKCAKNYGDSIVKKELTSTKKALKNHKYDNAEMSVVRALSFDLACHNDLKRRYHHKVPSAIFNVMKTYEELSEAACRIIEKI